MSVGAPASQITLHRNVVANGAGLADDVRRGLLRPFKSLPPKYFYDSRGSELFEQITELPEYYQTRTELAILQDAAAGIVRRHAPTELVELGSGSSRKTVALLAAMDQAGLLERFVPFDVSPSALMAAAERLAECFPGVRIDAVVGDFDHHLPHLPQHGPGARRMVIFLGGTIGNLYPHERRPFLRTLRSLLAPGDRLLLGVDLVKDHASLHAAYNDAAGVTAAFNLNVLRVMNRELGATFDESDFDHVAFYDPAAAWIEMRLRARRAHRVTIADLGLEVAFAAGEEMRTEISCKFTRSVLANELTGAGLRLCEFLTDDAGRFAVAIAARGDDPSGRVAAGH